MTKLNLMYLRCQDFIRRLAEDESGQGATEYILLLVVVVAIAMLFKNQIYSIVQTKIQQVGGDISGFTASGGSGQ